MLFHKDAHGLPASITNLFGRKYKLFYSHHAKLQAIQDRYGIISNPPREIELTKDNVFEVEILNNLISKVAIRIKYDNEKDLIIVLIPEYNTATVKTLWLNLSSDSHKTLDKSKYNRI